MGRTPMRAVLLAITLAVLAAASAAAGQRPAAPAPKGVIEGRVSTQAGAIALPGASVSVKDATGREVASQLTTADGQFRVEDVPVGHYTVTAAVEGLKTVEVAAVVETDRTTHLAIDLPIENVTEHVEVVAPAAVSGGGETIAEVSEVNGKELDQFTGGRDYQSALRLLSSVIALPSGLSIKGGRPDQASVQLGAGTLVDPSTGVSALKLPADAIESVQVLPNPYAVEFGRFSSGLVLINTRRAGDKWKIRLNDLDPNLRTERYNDLKVIGLQEWAPRLEVGGPLIGQKLFFEQTAQYRWATTDIPSLPESELKTDRWVSTLTRVDANLSDRHSAISNVGVYNIRSLDATLGTFTPPNATVNLRDAIWHASGTERALWSDTLLSESTVRVMKHTTNVDPQGLAPMQLLPDTTNGNFFNQQQRTTSSYQWVSTVSMTRTGLFGEHYLKAGLDLLHTDYDGWSLSRPVVIERPDGTVTRRLDFGGRSAQEVPSTDVALFAQDRFQPNAHWYLEFGGRLDRDGIVGRWNVTPRAGAAVVLDESGDTVLRGGWGLFYERTPSDAGAFDQYENAVDTRFDAGPQPVVTPVVHVISPDLQTARSSTWNLSLNQRLSASWSWHVGLLDRTGSHELIVNPQAVAGATELLLSSDGRSHYRDAELGVRYTHGPGTDISATYVRSSSRADLNAFTTFFGAIPWPIIGENAYGATAADVPNRLMVRGRVSTDRWLFLGIADWHSGYPYSIVNEALDFVGPRNVDRFPTAVSTELGAERRFTVLRWRPWIGIRVDNPFRAFLPMDVQANLASASFGSFYNSEYRKFRLIIRFER